MRALYDLGYGLATSGGGWFTLPPGRRNEP
jgi:hypothetical protein